MDIVAPSQEGELSNWIHDTRFPELLNHSNVIVMGLKEWYQPW